VPIPLRALAEEAGSPIMANAVGAGAAAALLGVDLDAVGAAVLGGLPEALRAKNRTAMALGARWARDRLAPRWALPRRPFRERAILSGNEALALGALAGGCKFAAGYPMTPGTGILAVLADDGPEVGLVFEQAEDEIAAINMAIGASYAGARSLVATSGGGFALMTESLSLAGMLETPVVIAVGMRPGPATGMPTRTEQGDLEFVLSAGHGEFPRLVFAPGSPEEAFALARRAMEEAERWQVPAIVLTDQYLADTVADVDPGEFEVPPVERFLVRGAAVPLGPDGRYLRYAVTETGVSPMAVPGEPGITVVAGSDEHTEDGHLTEDHAARIRMVEKRMRKEQGMAGSCLPPRLRGPAEGEILLVGFGSTEGVVAETREMLAAEGIAAAALHIPQVLPFPAGEVARILPRYETVFTVENNARGQLARLIRRECGMGVDGTLSRYDGLPFTPGRLAPEAGRVMWEARSRRMWKTRGAPGAGTSGS